MILDTATIKQQTDLVDLAGTYTELNRESSREHSGPCPKCGGTDRFHVTAEWFFCRQCHEKPGDCIEFVQWIGAASGFREAIAQLTGNGAMVAPTEKRKPERKPRKSTFDPAYWARRVETAHERLFHADSAAPGREYLLSRGLEPGTWVSYRLGYDPAMPLPGTNGKQTAPAISIPWYVGERPTLAHVRYRFFEKHTYTDADGDEAEAKQTGRGPNIGKLFGGQLVARSDQHERTLVIVEGEINAMSIWQVAHHTRLDVLSLGSQGQLLTDVMIAAAKRYRTVFVWTDEREHASVNTAKIPGAMGWYDKQDANDYLQAGKLGEFLSTLRKRLATGETARRTLLDDLRHGADNLIDTDEGTLGVMQSIADELEVAL